MVDKVSFDAIKRGDVKAYKTLFQQYYASMCTVAKRYIGDGDAAKDIAQEVFIKLWEKREEYDTIPNLEIFLYVLVRNRCFDYLKSRKDTVDYMDSEVVGNESFFRDLLIEEESYRIISQAIDALPPQSARVIKLSLDGKQNKEIAELLGISVNTVKTLKYRSLELLKTSLKDYFYILLILLGI
ncbi:RNA polymerase sigma-70 factor [Gabonibacter chumensis]|uniref:RNA polymerase sigma-70 factor n=1 Tax=Gabonibacter chumensis TaxID=2972474 RepID=UPI0025740A7B|nr:RNA polymerase sigma-70 factor [Gabonibacter chumensis]MCR9010867.1 RNA polymerase sigma-70 factor [Gabonibacter chumensis]